MLSYNPRRPSATELLTHPFFASAAASDSLTIQEALKVGAIPRIIRDPHLQKLFSEEWLTRGRGVSNSPPPARGFHYPQHTDRTPPPPIRRQFVRSPSPPRAFPGMPPRGVMRPPYEQPPPRQPPPYAYPQHGGPGWRSPSAQSPRQNRQSPPPPSYAQPSYEHT